MIQRMSDKKRKQVERETGLSIYSMWHRGGRRPRYYNLFLREDDAPEGKEALYYPDTGKVEMTDTIVRYERED